MAGTPGSRIYRRTLRLPYGSGLASVDEASPGGPWLEARIQ
ncbi:AraC family transcriptional regulator, regulatory protein of adaptative response / DNA-3-methyladenine glycosylase II, partial [Streptomyces sp. Ncost-T6T-2b]